MEYNEWLEDVIRLECLLFVKTDIYLLVERKKRSKCLTFSERKQLCVDVFEIFQRLIGVLQTSCPKLTKEDILFCCLFKVGQDCSFINCCMGSISRPAFNQRRYRIRKKMTQAKSEILFELIFGA